MKQFRLLLAATLLVGLALSSCKNKGDDSNDTQDAAPSPTMEVRLKPRFNGGDFAVGTEYTLSTGHRVRLDVFRNYITFVKLHNTNGSYQIIKDFTLADLSIANPTFKADIAAGHYDSLIFNIGIPAEYNAGVDPAGYPSSSPLSVAGAGNMFWNWNSGYIFLMCDGKTDTTGAATGTLLDPFAFHIGDDVTFHTVSLPMDELTVNAGENKSLDLYVDLDKIFVNDEDTINLAVDYLTHTSGNLGLAKRVMSNYSRSFSLE